MMIDYEAFLGRYYSTANEWKQKDVTRFLDNLAEIIGDTPLEQALQNENILCSAFFLQENGGSISRPHYQKIKEYLLNLFAFCGVQSEVPTREVVMSSQQSVGYFRGINELMSFIDSVGAIRLESYNPTTDLVNVKSICVLGWLGFSPNEIAEMKKSALKPLGLDKYQITHGDEVFEVSGAPFAALYYLSDLESYKGLPTGKRMNLTGDPSYLFRPTIHSQKLVGDSIIQIIKRFNAQIPITFTQRAIIFRNLHKNALFVEVYNDKSDKSLLQKIIDIMKCDQHYALSYREQYLRFVSALESNKI